MEVFEICKRVLKINTKLPKLHKKRQDYFETLGLGLHPKWDSLNHVKILYLIEKKYSVKIEEANIAHFNNICKIAKFLSRKKY